MMEEFGLLLKMMYNYQAEKRLGGVSGIEKMALLTDQQEVESTVMTGRLDHPHTYWTMSLGKAIQMKRRCSTVTTTSHGCMRNKWLAC
jgi:hypothetical protein